MATPSELTSAASRRTRKGRLGDRVLAAGPLHPPPSRPWALAALAAIALVVYSALGVGGQRLDEIVDYGLHIGLMAIGALLCLIRGLRFRAERAAWLFIAAAMTATTVGDALYAALYADVASPPVPSVADGFWLAFVPLAGVGLALLVRARFPRPDAARWVEGLQAAMLVAALGLMGIFYPVLEGTSGSDLEVVINLAYPLGDIVLMGSILGVLALSGFRPGSAWVPLGAGFFVFGLSDAIYSVQATLGTYRVRGVLDAGWPAAHLLIAYAAWMPSRTARRVRSDDWRTAILPVIVWCVGIVIQVGSLVGFFAGGYRAPRTFLIAAQTLLLFKIAAAPLSARRLACEDSLTGLSNRRALARDLARRFRRRSSPALLLLAKLHGLSDIAMWDGHRRRDELLVGVARRLADALGDRAAVYRLEEGEFCLLAELERSLSERDLVAAFERALGAEGGGLRASYGAVSVPGEASEPTEALARAEDRLYGREASERQGTPRATPQASPA